MLRFLLSFIGAIFSWLVTAVFFIALTVGAVFWMYSRDLPSHEQLAQYAPKTISRIYSAEGRLIDEFAEERRIFVPIDEIPPLVKQAFISAEDKHFYSHHGFDPMGMGKAALDAISSGGRNLRGASTITQQVMKNFLLSSDRSIERKIKELILATRLESTLSKDQILELYLNEIFLGQNSFGVAAAAQSYFNKPLTELAPHEAATLAAMPKAPGRYHPVRAREALTERRDYVLREMWQNGYIDQATYEAEARQPLRSVQNGDFPAFQQQLPPRDYFTDEIRRQLSAQFGAEEFFGGGLAIRATVDPKLQQVAAHALQQALEKYDRGRGVWRGTRLTIPAEQLGDEQAWRAALSDAAVPRDIEGWFPAVVLALGEGDATIGIEDQEGTATIPAKDVQWARKRRADGTLAPKAQVASDLLDVGDVVLVRRMTSDSDGSFIRWTLRQVPEVQGGFMAMDVNTGRVIAMQGGFSYQSSVFNRATQAQRQPGSSFKPFVYAAALDSGFNPATIVVDEPITVNTPQGLWTPKNASGKFYGPTPMRTGIEQSRNLMTIRIAQGIGMDTVAKYAEKFGVYDHLGHFLANSLGAQETTLFKMVAAYAMFANGGERVEPTLVDRVQDRRGRTIYRHDRRDCVTCGQPTLPAGAAPEIRSNRERVMDAITAYQLTSMLEGVVKRGSGRGVNLPVPVAGKTGTTNDAKDVWFIGFTSNIVAGCYLGYDQPRTLGANAYGGTLCVPVFNEFMQEAVKEFGGTAFKVPPGGHFVNIDRFSGAILGPDAKGDNVIAEYFRDGQDLTGLVLVDGGFGRADPGTLPLFTQGRDGGQAVTTSTGKKKVIPKKADFGTLSSGGLY
ncbi:penicillin-binding protein 1A [Paracoccus sp. P2]|uniref:Penicillin-binding protein 1A n=1 Tax=Paracoccus pantotrophus TaxID=82367 RepID=A0A7H9BSA7_PARPN|nr:penicillin-binding protein 1A [Paracoccus pantotrophus]QLH13866.1 penicillin-binding protein 1A [Paracoccus pantotrophus]RDE01042.1 penicillin-binding protein 1A [Paracoccus pantotrophus]RNI17514.1 penicillin-binding protein 1A [Paracoccus pantotrophus]WGR67001.1 penicillin-binding protein 1A [Paracoccus pantotrophus]